MGSAASAFFVVFSFKGCQMALGSGWRLTGGGWRLGGWWFTNRSWSSTDSSWRKS